MVILNVSVHQFSFGKNRPALNGAAMHIMWAHREGPSLSPIFLSFRCLYSWRRKVWLIGISKPADYHVSHFFSISAQQIHANGGLFQNVISQCCKSISQWASTVWQRFFFFFLFLHKDSEHRRGRKQREKVEHCMKHFHCQFVLNRPPMCSLWSFSRLFRNRPRVCKGAGRDEHNWYCGSHTLCLLKFHNR